MADLLGRAKLLGAGVLLAGLLGGADLMLYALIGFSVADYLTGLVKAVVRRELHSARAFAGGLKKILIYVVVAVAATLDRVLQIDGIVFRSLVIGYYLACEGLSILENVALCGLPLPGKLKAVLTQLKGP